MKLINRFKYTIPSIIIALIIFIVSSQSTIRIPNIGIDFLDKILHAVGYFFFGASVIIMSLVNFPTVNKRKKIIIVMIIGMVYAFSDEIHQSFVPGRDADILDWLADVIGITASLLLYYKTKFGKLIKIPE